MSTWKPGQRQRAAKVSLPPPSPRVPPRGLVTHPDDTGAALVFPEEVTGDGPQPVCGQRLLDITGMVARHMTCVLPLDQVKPICPQHGARTLPDWL